MQVTTMDRIKLQAPAAELAKDIKTEADLNALSRELLKLTVETALNAELTDHLATRSTAIVKQHEAMPATAPCPNALKVSMPKSIF